MKDAYAKLYEKQHPDLPKQRPDVVVTLIRKRQANDAKDYKIRRGDVLGLFIAGILPPSFDEQPPVYLNLAEPQLPSLGYPIPVADTGIIALPLIEPLLVVGKSLREVEEQIRKAYLVEQELLSPQKLNRILVSTMWIATNKSDGDPPHRLKPGDTLALVLLDSDNHGERNALLSFGPDMIRVSETGRHLPFWGFPFPVRSDGTLDSPLIPPVRIEGLTLAEARKEIVQAYTIDRITLESTPFCGLSLIREQKTRKAPLLDYSLDSGDVVCVYGVPGKRMSKPDFFFPDDSSLPPCFGELFLVLPDGNVLIPLAGPIKARGKSLNELKKAIEEKYKEIELNPQLKFVIVQLAHRRK